MYNEIITKGTAGSSGCVLFMNQNELKAYINKLIEDDCLWKFYKKKEWIKLKNQILKENHYECEICKKQGKITRYDVDKNGNKQLLSTVHHVQYVRTHPELALSRTYTYNGKVYVNLIPICKACHNKIHPRSNKKQNAAGKFTNKEQW